jgi:hypothetical protein
MNTRSVKKRKPANARRKVAVRKTAVRKAPVRKAALAKVAAEAAPSATISIGTVSVVQVMARAPALRTHKYSVGQTVFYTSSPITRPGASGSYQVVRLLPSDGEDYQYRIKNPGEAFERVAKESQLDLDH